jgi:hypothetical protein
MTAKKETEPSFGEAHGNLPWVNLRVVLNDLRTLNDRKKHRFRRPGAGGCEYQILFYGLSLFRWRFLIATFVGAIFASFGGKVPMPEFLRVILNSEEIYMRPDVGIEFHESLLFFDIFNGLVMGPIRSGVFHFSTVWLPDHFVCNLDL